MNASSLALLGVCLAIGAAGCAILALDAANHESKRLWLALASLSFVAGSSLCLFTSFAAFLMGKLNRQQSESQPITRRAAIDGEYVATYSWSDRAKALIVAGSFGILTVFLLLRSKDWRGIALSGTFFGVSVIYVLHIVGTSVRFTREGFIARLSWLRQFDAPYNLVNRISSKPGTLKIEFSDGRSLKIHSGLGNPDVIIALLQERCPESIHLE